MWMSVDVRERIVATVSVGEIIDVIVCACARGVRACVKAYRCERNKYPPPFHTAKFTLTHLIKHYHAELSSCACEVNHMCASASVTTSE